jgi:hypothetical protein
VLYNKTVCWLSEIADFQTTQSTVRRTPKKNFGFQAYDEYGEAAVGNCLEFGMAMVSR